jgi:hypothetical protein
MPAKSPAQAASRPVLLTDGLLGGVQRFYLVEYRTQNTTGRNVTPSDKDVGHNRAGSRFGVAIWYVEHVGNGANGAAPAVIGPGLNGTLDTPPSADDEVGTYLEQTAILPGRNRWLDSIPRSGDTYLGGGDTVNWIVGAPRDGSPAGARGETYFWNATDNGNLQVDFKTGRKNAVRSGAATSLRISPANATSTGTTIEIKSGSPRKVRARLDGIANTTIRRGRTISVQGAVGVDQNSRLVTLTRGLSRYTLTPSEWTCDGFRARIPLTMEPGRYTLTVWNDSTRTTRGNRLTVRVE